MARRALLWRELTKSKAFTASSAVNAFPDLSQRSKLSQARRRTTPEPVLEILHSLFLCTVTLSRDGPRDHRIATFVAGRLWLGITSHLHSEHRLVDVPLPEQ